MEIRDLEKEIIRIVDKIDEKFSVKHNKEITLLHLIEEIGEIAREINKPKMRNKETDSKNLKDEIGDVLILLTKLADNYNVSIEDAIKDKINKLKTRHNLEEENDA
jgi:NTP pyrophosphatase (non-canonical NTP hydrolase)